MSEYRITEGTYYPQEVPIDWDLLDEALVGKPRTVHKVGWPGGTRAWDYTMNQLWAVYSLRCPGEEVRYVGITRMNPAWRLMNHQHGLESEQKARWRRGRRLIMEILTTLRGTKADAMAVEVILSRHFKSLGHDMINREARSRAAA